MFSQARERREPKWLKRPPWLARPDHVGEAEQFHQRRAWRRMVSRRRFPERTRHPLRAGEKAIARAIGTGCRHTHARPRSPSGADHSIGVERTLRPSRRRRDYIVCQDTKAHKRARTRSARCMKRLPDLKAPTTARDHECHTTSLPLETH